MTPKKHSRKVTVNRRTGSHVSAQSAEHKIVTVRLKNSSSVLFSPPIEKREHAVPPQKQTAAAETAVPIAEPSVSAVTNHHEPMAAAETDTTPGNPVEAAPRPEPPSQEESDSGNNPAADVPSITDSKAVSFVSEEAPSEETTVPAVSAASDKPTCKEEPEWTPPAVMDNSVTAVEPTAADIDVSAGNALPVDNTPEATVSGKWYIPQKWEDISLLRKLIMIASVALALFSMLPLAVGVISPGIVPPVMIAAFFFACALYWPVINGCESTWGNVAIAVVAVCVLAGVTYLSFVSGKMISASANVLPEDRGDVTVVVLGCKINGDQPSRMLHARLEKASEFLLAHPQSHCIVTGGKGADEDYPESYVMKKYLVDKGISPMRIIMEDKSTSTLENINFAAELADIYNCHDRFLIVTDRFHQYRAVTAANDLGIVTYALNVETVWYLAMPYWFREMAAITRDWFVA